MSLDVLARAEQVSAALGDLARAAARNVVLVRGSRGSAGSGVVWDATRLIVTNHHVVPGPVAELTLADGRRLTARVVRRAPALDLAALEPEADPGAGAEVGDSDQLRVGDLLVAVGNPMGERNAPSLGILASAPDDVLRMSITLRPGNSGGALLNARGEVVGIPHMVTGTGLALAVATRSVRRFLAGATGEAESADLRWV